MLTPWVVNGGQHEIYVEVIGPVGPADNIVDVNPTKSIVQLYE